MLIVSKSSKLEWDCLNNKVSKDDMIESYVDDGINVSPIMDSHKEQLMVRESVRNSIKSADFCMMHELSEDNISGHDLIISCSGDNGLSYISKYLSAGQVIAPINSSPTYSSGILTRWDYRDISKLLHGDYRVEGWTRLGSDLLPKSPALSEIYLGEQHRQVMSRHIIEYRGKSYEQKCSGLVIATGAGSTGWFSSINGTNSVDDNKFSPSDNLAKFVVTEPFRFNKGDSLIGGELLYGEKLIIHSLNSGGIISSDSWDSCDFNKGTVTEITITNPLKVAAP